MRKLVFALLLAGVASPVLAAGGPGDRMAQIQAERDQRVQARQDARAERQQQRAEPAQMQRQQQQLQQLQQQARPNPFANRGAMDNQARGAEIQAMQQQRAAQIQAMRAQRQMPDGARNWKGQRVDPRQAYGYAAGGGGGPRTVYAPGDRQQRANDLRQTIDQRRQARLQDRQGRIASRPISNIPRPGTQPPPVRADHGPSVQPQWRDHWRHDDRYDWQGWRGHHRSLFHLNFYVDPFGWGYQPYSIGWRLWPDYYGSNYWLDDPYMYRLPPSPPGTRWIRYYDDALLVDMWDGQVVDVLYNFFW